MAEVAREGWAKQMAELREEWEAGVEAIYRRFSQECESNEEALSGTVDTAAHLLHCASSLEEANVPVARWRLRAEDAPVHHEMDCLRFGSVPQPGSRTSRRRPRRSHQVGLQAASLAKLGLV